MTQWRKHKKWETAAAGTAGIASFFYSTVSSSKETFEISSLNRSLMSEGEKICDIDGNLSK